MTDKPTFRAVTADELLVMCLHAFERRVAKGFIDHAIIRLDGDGAQIDLSRSAGEDVFSAKAPTLIGALIQVLRQDGGDVFRVPRPEIN